MAFLTQYGWYFILAAIIGEIVVPFLLAPFYKSYNHSFMPISVLGSPSSPVRFWFNGWMLLAGILFLLGTPALYHTCKTISTPLSVACVLCLSGFAVGACILSCFFSVEETKNSPTLAAKIHGAGSAIGFMLLLVVPLLLSILFFKAFRPALGAASAVSFVLALASFTLFVMADKPKFKYTPIAWEGLWQRLSLLFMYLPLALASVQNILL